MDGGLPSKPAWQVQTTWYNAPVICTLQLAFGPQSLTGSQGGAGAIQKLSQWQEQRRLENGPKLTAKDPRIAVVTLWAFAQRSLVCVPTWKRILSTSDVLASV